MNSTGKTTSLKNAVVYSFTLFVIVVVGITDFIAFSGWRETTNTLICNMENEASEQIIQNIEDFVNVPLTILDTNSHYIQNGIVDIYVNRQREAYFINILKATPIEVYSFSYGTEQGEYYGARRNLRNQIEIMRNDSSTDGHSYYFDSTSELTAGEFNNDYGRFDPRTRDWYKAALGQKNPSFSSVYKHFIMDDLALSASQPVYDKDGILKGVLGVHLTLSKINDYLQTVTSPKKAIALIVEKSSGMIVANSLNRSNFTTRADMKVDRIRIEDLALPELLNAYNEYSGKRQGNNVVKTESDRIHIKITAYQRQGLDWLIITAIPESEFMKPITNTFLNALYTTIVLLIFGVIMWIGRVNQALRPMCFLKEAMQKFSSGDLSHRAKIYRNDEIGEMALEFNKMADALSTTVDDLDERFIKSFNMNPNIMVITSMNDNSYVDVNSAFLKVSGLLREEIIGRTIDEFSLIDLEERLAIRELFLKQEHVQNYEMKYQANGEVYIGLLSCEKIIIDGSPCILHVITDITDKIKHNMELARLSSLNLVGEMAASIGHEVRNPMTTVKGYLQWFQRKEKFNAYQDQLSIMIEEIDRANSIITEFLSLAKNKTVQIKPGNLNEVLNALLPLLQAEVYQSGHELKVEQSVIPDILMNNGEVRQLIMNMVRNGIEAMEPGMAISIKSYLENDKVVLAIHDTGKGIQKAILDKLGMPFLTTKDKGTGLGLAVSYRIAERHNAKIEVETSPKGTTFYIKFDKYSNEIE